MTNLPIILPGDARALASDLDFAARRCQQVELGLPNLHCQTSDSEDGVEPRDRGFSAGLANSWCLQ